MPPQDTPARLAALAVVITLCAAFAWGADTAPPAEDVPPALRELVMRMERSEEGLAGGRTGEEVATAQREVVRLLDLMIGELEKQRRSSAGQPGEASPGEAEGDDPGGDPHSPERPAEESAPARGEAEGGVTGSSPQVRDAWMATLPPAEREQVEQAFKDGTLPPRYRRLIEQYSKRLAEGDVGAGGQE